MEKLTILLFICHFLADYTVLSTNRMLAAKRYADSLLPILEHAAVHALLMFLALYFYDGCGWLIGFTLASHQWFSHFFIDVLKGRTQWWLSDEGKTDISTKRSYWFLFGFDQLLHAIIIVVMTTGTIYELLWINAILGLAFLVTSTRSIIRFFKI